MKIRQGTKDNLIQDGHAGEGRYPLKTEPVNRAIAIILMDSG